MANPLNFLQTTNYPQSFLEGTFGNKFYQNVVEPAKLGTGPKPTLGQVAKNWNPLKAFTPQMLATGPTKAASTFLKGSGIGTLAGLLFDATPANADEVEWEKQLMKNQQFKQQQLMNQRKQDMQRQIREAEAAEAAKQKAAADAKAKADAAAHKEARATGGDYHSGHESTVDGQTTDWGPSSHMIARGGLAQRAPRYANGGLIDFFRYGGFIG